MRIAGVYNLLLEQERVYGGEPDPRWARTEGSRRGDAYPATWRGPARLLTALEAGEPVQAGWQRIERLLRKAGEIGQLVTAHRPEGRVERFLWTVWRDRSIVGLLVYSDDMVVPKQSAR